MQLDTLQASISTISVAKLYSEAAALRIARLSILSMIFCWQTGWGGHSCFPYAYPPGICR